MQKDTAVTVSDCQSLLQLVAETVAETGYA